MEEVDPSMLIDRLEIHDRKLIEICRVLATAPEILIIDETTTALSHHGREITYSIMRSMKDAGKAKEKSIT
jgi:ribose transport system ATP-binding protein